MYIRRRRTSRIRRPSDRRGAATVEFALTVPILLMLLFAALEFGRMNMLRETANNAAYEAARMCIVPGATNAEGVDTANKLLQSIGVINASVQVAPATITDTTGTVTATVSVPYAANMWVAPLYSTVGSATATCTLTRDWVVSTRSSQ